MTPNAMSDPTANPAQAGAAPPEAPEAPDDMSQGYVIEVSVLPDGTFTVDTEPLQEEAQEENGEPAEGPGKTYQSKGEVLKAVLDLINNNGQADDSNEQFQSGFSGSSAPTAKTQ